MLNELTLKEQEAVSGGYIQAIVAGIALAEAAYDFYKGYSENRR